MAYWAWMNKDSCGAPVLSFSQAEPLAVPVPRIGATDWNCQSGLPHQGSDRFDVKGVWK